MQYILILYAYDTNEILVKPIKKRIYADMLSAYDFLYDTIENAVQEPKLSIVEN